MYVCYFFFVWSIFHLHCPCRDFHYTVVFVFYYRAAWGPKKHSVLFFGLVPCTQRFLWILAVFWWYHCMNRRWSNPQVLWNFILTSLSTVLRCSSFSKQTIMVDAIGIKPWHVKNMLRLKPPPIADTVASALWMFKY